MTSETQTVRRDRCAAQRESRVFIAIVIAATVAIYFAFPALSRMSSAWLRPAGPGNLNNINTDTTTTRASGGRERTTAAGASDRVPSAKAAPAPSGRDSARRSAAPGTTPTSAAMRIVVPAAFRARAGT